VAARLDKCGVEVERVAMGDGLPGGESLYGEDVLRVLEHAATFEPPSSNGNGGGLSIMSPITGD
jgi:hypothetical protein